MKKPKPSPVSLQEIKIGGGQLWRVYRGGAFIGFVERLAPEPHTTHPFKVFQALCGYGGPPRRGDMIAADYRARTALEAATNAAPQLR